MAEYYFENLESYSDLFKNHASSFSELMKILDDEIIGMGLPPVGRTKDLFRMTMDLSFAVDRSYREKHEIEDEFKLTTYMGKEDTVDAMKTVLREEFQRFMETQNADQ